jgi:uncharacterized iron-regulated protein
MKRVLLLAVLCLAGLSSAAVSRADDPALDLPIGDPARRDRHAPLAIDGVTDAATGDIITPREMAARLKDVRLLFVGESHTDIEFHNAQLRTIQELVRAGRKVMVGLEMFPYTEQAPLDQWNEGKLSEAEFLKAARWYKNWGYHWNYYREVFLFARDHKVPLYAVNTPREVVSAVRKKGFANLTPEEAAHIPAKIDTDNAEHYRLFKAFFTEADSMHSAGMGEEMWQGMFRAQCTWDATMGYNAAQALRKHGDREAIMVVLIGSGHVAYGLGAERQARLWFDGKIASLIPIAVVEQEKCERKPVVVRASYADFLWGLPASTTPLYPSLGLSTPSGESFKVINVPKGSVAAEAGFAVGDELLTMDGQKLESQEQWKTLLSEKRWGDASEFTVQRGDTTPTLVARFRRRMPEPPLCPAPADTKAESTAKTGEPGASLR